MNMISWFASRRASVATRLSIALVLAALASAGCNREPQAKADADNHSHENSAGHADAHGHGSADAHGHGSADAHGHGDADAHADEVHLTAEAVTRYGIKVEAAQRMVLAPTIVAPARVGFDLDAVVHVGSPVRGRVVELPARLGSQVRRGDALAVIESPELGEAQAEYFQKRTAAEASKPSVELARVSWERAKGLYEKSQGVSLTESQRREAEYFAAVAAQKSLQASVIGGEIRLRLLGMDAAAIEALAATGEITPRYAIRAAIDGQVVEREVTLGELVGPDRETLMVLADASTLWVTAAVPESRLREISPGAKARVTAATAGSKSYEGVVAFIAPLIDPVTRAAVVRVNVPTAAMSLTPGMFAQVEITASPVGADNQTVIAVPDDAVQTVEGGPAVFVPVAGEPGTFAKRAVTVGKAVGGLVPIHSGLGVGESFVARGAFILKAELGKAGAEHEH